jgi:hypothetical protein
MFYVLYSFVTYLLTLFRSIFLWNVGAHLPDYRYNQ